MKAIVSSTRSFGPPAGWTDFPLKPGLPPCPDRIAKLPIAKNGYPVPFFVSWVDGEPEFRAADSVKMVKAVNEKRCWVCGQHLGKTLAFLLGPMCTINRVVSEPPSHPECADYSVRACPFLSKPQMVRRDNDLPDGTIPPPGLAIMRNPACIAIWTTLSFEIVPQSRGFLFGVGDPLSVAWWKESRLATREDVIDSVTTGLPVLMEQAQKDGPQAVRLLAKMCQQALQHYPGGAP
jgi:hypothetical protein